MSSQVAFYLPDPKFSWMLVLEMKQNVCLLKGLLVYSRKVYFLIMAIVYIAELFNADVGRMKTSRSFSRNSITRVRTVKKVRTVLNQEMERSKEKKHVNFLFHGIFRKLAALKLRVPYRHNEYNMRKQFCLCEQNGDSRTVIDDEYDLWKQVSSVKWAISSSCQNNLKNTRCIQKHNMKL